MNRYIFIFAFILLLLKSFSQNVFIPAGTPSAEVQISKETTKSIVYRKDTVSMIDYKTIKFENTYGINFPRKAPNGKYILFYDNDTSKVYATINYLKELINDTYIEYYHNGNIKYYLNYFIGKLNGTCKHFNPNGKLQLIEYYIDGKEYGESTHYNDDGTINYIAHYKNGKPHGIFKTWKRYADGRIEYEEKYFIEGKELKK